MDKMKDLEQRIRDEDDKLTRLHQAVWKTPAWNGTEHGFNEKNYHKFRRAVENIGKEFPGLYARFYPIIQQYEIMLRHK